MSGQHGQWKAGSASCRQGDIGSTFVRQGCKARLWALNGHLGCKLSYQRFELLATGLCSQGCAAGLSKLDSIVVHLLWYCQGSMLQKQVIANFGICLAEFVGVLRLLSCCPLVAS